MSSPSSKSTIQIGQVSRPIESGTTSSRTTGFEEPSALSCPVDVNPVGTDGIVEGPPALLPEGSVTKPGCKLSELAAGPYNWRVDIVEWLAASLIPSHPFISIPCPWSSIRC